MRTVNVHEAKTHFSRLVEAAAAGEEVVIAKAGRPVARLMPLETPKPPATRRMGFIAGEFTVPDDFDDMFANEIAEMFGTGD